MKQLLLAAMVACSATSPPEAVSTWLDRWDDLRRCWVGETSHAIEVELAIRELTGKRCRASFEFDPRDAPDFAVTIERATHLAKTLPHAPSIAERAAMIRTIDRDASYVRRSVGLAVVEEVESALPNLAFVDVALPEVTPSEVATATLRAKDRIITLRSQPHGRYELADSHDAGRTWKTQNYAYRSGLAQDPRSGTIELVLDFKYATRLVQFTTDAMLDDGDGVEKWIELGVPGVGGWRVACRAARARWFVGPGQITRLGEARVEKYKSRWVDPRTTELACDDDVAVVLHRGHRFLERCEMGACNRELEIPHHHGGDVAVVDGTWVYVAALDGVLGVWRQDARPRFYRVATTGRVERIAVIDGIAYVALGVRVVRLPTQDELRS
jgi:hypothetical protein